MSNTAFLYAALSGLAAGLAAVLVLTRILKTQPFNLSAQVHISDLTAPIHQLAKAANTVVPVPLMSMTRTRMRLARAGLGMTPGLWHGISILFYVGVALVAAPLLSALPLDAKTQLLSGICVAVVALVLPRLFLVVRARNRMLKIKSSLSSTLDLLAVSVEGGLTVSRAIALVCEKSEGPLADEFKMVLRDINYLGFTLAQALAAMAERCRIEELSLFVAAISASVASGAPVASTLKAQSEVMFTRHCQELEERANKMPAQMVIPIGAFMLTSVIIAAVAPIAINILASMQTAGV